MASFRQFYSNDSTLGGIMGVIPVKHQSSCVIMGHPIPSLVTLFIPSLQILHPAKTEDLGRNLEASSVQDMDGNGS